MDRFCWQHNIVPYIIASEFTPDQKQQILAKIGVFHSLTCLRWVDVVELTLFEGVHDLLSFVKAPAKQCGLTANALTQRNVTKVSVSIELSDFCFEEKFVLHMMMQGLGFRNEHQRYDRNCYVVVSRYVSNSSSFQIQAQEPWLERYLYDLQSVMHYRQSSELYSRRSRVTPLGSADDSMSELDVSKVLFKFCGGRHICEVTPERCRQAESYKRGINCDPNHHPLVPSLTVPNLFG